MEQMQNQTKSSDIPADNAAAAGGKASFWRRRPVIIIGTVVLAVLLLAGLRYLALAFTHESTDDAFLDANFISIAPKVAGQVKKVSVADNQAVKSGDLLVEIDPRDLQAAFDQKRAAVDSAKANVEMLKAGVELGRAQIASTEATAKQTTAEAAAAEAGTQKAQADFKRAQELFANHTISPQEFDSAKMAVDWAEANLKAAREKAASSHAKVTEVVAQLQAALRALDRGEAQARQAQWDAQAAELNLSYAHIAAPGDGYVTKKAVETGNYVQVGQNLMALVPDRGVFVTANFKESQLMHIRPGQSVRISIDSLPGGPFRGHVDSTMAGSGARFSLLPPENAVGNYVKVVQRIPVKIIFDKPVESGHVLGPGMSVVPLVRVKNYEISATVTDVAGVALAVVIGVIWWRLAGRELQKVKVEFQHTPGQSR